MKKMHSSHSVMQTIICLQTTAFLLEHYSCLLSDLERLIQIKFVITQSENMEKLLFDRIITLHSSIFDPVGMELPADLTEFAARAASLSKRLGDLDTSTLDSSRKNHRRILQDIALSLSKTIRKLEEDQSRSQECR